MLKRCVLGLGLLAGCGSAPPSFVNPGSGSGSDSDGGNIVLSNHEDGGGVALGDDASFGTSSDDAGVATNCASGAGTFIYVITDTNDLYTFDPTAFPALSAFTLVGPVTCGGGSGVNSMAVDRSATAWVNFNDGSIFKVTTTAPITCTATGFASKQAGFTKLLGMGFAADAPGGNTETLFVSDNAGPGGTCKRDDAERGVHRQRARGKIDLPTMTLTALGPYTDIAAGYDAELTGTGDGHLYGFFTTTPASYGPIDETSGATSTPPPTAIPSVNAATGGYAFSFWGGDFYFYTAPTDTTVVTHLQTSTGATTVSPELGFTIVGAGVSTCAPTVPPLPK